MKLNTFTGVFLYSLPQANVNRLQHTLTLTPHTTSTTALGMVQRGYGRQHIVGAHTYEMKTKCTALLVAVHIKSSKKSRLRMQGRLLCLAGEIDHRSLLRYRRVIGGDLNVRYRLNWQYGMRHRVGSMA